MFNQTEYDKDLLTLQEDFDFDSSPRASAPDSIYERIKVPIKVKTSQSSSMSTPILRLTPHTLPVLTKPAIINGKPVTDLKRLKPTNTIVEVRMRENNSHQRFITKEGTSIYLERDTIRKINFEENMKRRWDKTINLSQKHQARLRVYKDGRILFHHYHRRGQSKFKVAQPMLNGPFNGGEYVGNQSNTNNNKQHIF